MVSILSNDILLENVSYTTASNSRSVSLSYTIWSATSRDHSQFYNIPFFIAMLHWCMAWDRGVREHDLPGHYPGITRPPQPTVLQFMQGTKVHLVVSDFSKRSMQRSTLVLVNLYGSCGLIDRRSSSFFIIHFIWHPVLEQKNWGHFC